MTAGIDDRARQLHTVRVSLTSRCDLDCVYCNAENVSTEMSRATVEAITNAAWLARARTIRFTGGEPLLRDDLEAIISAVAGGPHSGEVALTTNARRLSGRARALAAAGLTRVNIGMPSLRPETYRRMTGCALEPALEGIDAALEFVLAPVKINVVVIRGTNDGEIADFVDLARAKPLEVRFIERMPFAGQDGTVPSSHVIDAVRCAVGPDAVLGPVRQTATSEMYQPAGFEGSIGTISPMTSPFCSRCDRLRVASDGSVRSCLAEAGERNVARMVDEGASPREIAEVMLEVFRCKPERHDSKFPGQMRSIGG